MNKKVVTMLLAIIIVMSAASIIEAKKSEEPEITSMSDISISGTTVNIPPIPPVIMPTIPPFAHGNNQPPSTEAIAFAQRTSDHLTNMLLAALVKEIGDTTPENVAEGNLSIGLLFSDSQTNFRLVGTFAPISENDNPQDKFEETALAQALKGQPYTDVQRVKGKWVYRRSVPLSNFVPQCAMCHPNFASLAPTDNVGALMLKVPIKKS
ncbi:MAG TPA: hypothetical protein VIO58_08270 [Candidatus Methanoperedens sp.]